MTLLSAQLSHPILLFPIQTIGNGTWIAVLLAGLLAILLYWPAAAALQRLGHGNLIDLARQAGGAPGEMAVALILGAALVFDAGAVMRETAEMTISFAYPHTPQTFAMVAVTMCALYGSSGRTVGIIRLGRLFLPGLLLTVLLVIAGSVGWGEPRFLLPLWGTGLQRILGDQVPLLSLFLPVLFPLLSVGEARDRQHLVRSGAVALGAYTALLSATTVVYLMAFPLPVGGSVAFPLHFMSRLTIGGRFLERLDGIWLCIWAFGTAIYLSAILHMAATALAGAFAFPSHRVAILPLGALAATVALFPPDMGRVLVDHFAAAPLFAAVAFGLPQALILLARLRRRGART